MSAELAPEIVRKLRFICEHTKQTAREVWDKQSPSTRLAAEPDKWAKFIAGWANDRLAKLRGVWKFWARPAQLPPLGLWFIWLILAGRGWGKSRAGSEFVIEQARSRPGSRGAIVGATASDIRSTMILGESGIMACSPMDFKPVYEPSKLILTWPNGSTALIYSGDSPSRLRGPNLNWAWVDELASFRYPEEAWKMLMMCTRSKKARAGSPRVVVTTTPRPIPLIRSLVASAGLADLRVRLTSGSSWDNYWNLAADWFRDVVLNTTGDDSRQEIWAEILDDIAGSLWSRRIIDSLRVLPASVPQCDQVYVGVDPILGMDKAGGDECGIVAVGRGINGHGYVLEDWTCGGTAGHWGRQAYELWKRLEADAIVVETNRGGKMCAEVIRGQIKPGEPQPRIIEVTATRGKTTRAEPISGLYEIGRFHHVGSFPRLEDQMCNYIPGMSSKSPDRMDAMVWAAAALFKLALAAPVPETRAMKSKPAGW